MFFVRWYLLCSQTTNADNRKNAVQEAVLFPGYLKNP